MWIIGAGTVPAGDQCLDHLPRAGPRHRADGHGPVADPGDFQLAHEGGATGGSPSAQLRAGSPVDPSNRCGKRSCHCHGGSPQLHGPY